MTENYIIVGIELSDIHGGLTFEEARERLRKAGMDMNRHIASYIDEQDGKHVFFQTRKGNVING